MNRELRFTPEAKRNLEDLQKSRSKVAVLKQVRKTLGLLETNVRHPSLQTHRFYSLSGPKGEEVEAYVKQRTPGAYRIFFYYGPDRVERNKRVAVLTIAAITPHP